MELEISQFRTEVQNLELQTSLLEASLTVLDCQPVPV